MILGTVRLKNGSIITLDNMGLIQSDDGVLRGFAKLFFNLLSDQHSIADGSFVSIYLEKLAKLLNGKANFRETPNKKSGMRDGIHIKSGPSFTGSFLDTRNRRTCLQDGKHVPCEEFGGQGRGWTSLREEEDLYDATRRLIDKVKTGSGDWSELFGLLAHAHPEELQKIIRDHKLSTPPEDKPALQQFVQEQLQQMGHVVRQQPQQQTPQQAGQPQSGMM